jgi:hypothetical protein
MDDVKVSLDLTLSKDILERTSKVCVETMFAKPQYGHTPGDGYRAVESAIQKYLQNLDLVPHIKEAVEKAIMPVMVEVVRDRLKKMAKEELKRLLEAQVHDR